MVRSFLFEIKFYKYKYKIFKIETNEKVFYDVLKYHKSFCIWINIQFHFKNKNIYYLRFDNFNKLIYFIFKDMNITI